MNESHTNTAEVEIVAAQDQAPAGNLSLAEFAARRRPARQAAPSEADAGQDPTPEAPDVDSEQTQDPGELESQTTETPDNTEEIPGELEATTETQAQPPANLEAFIQQCIQEAGMEGDTAKAIQKMTKRLAKVIDERDLERNQRLNLQAKLQEREQPQEQAPQQANPATAIDATIDKLSRAIAVLERNPDGYTFTDPKGQEITLSPEEVSERLSQYRDAKAEAVAERRIQRREAEAQAQRTMQEANAVATTHYPWTMQPQATEYQAAIQEIKQLGPEAAQLLARVPQLNLIMGRYMAGLRAEQAAAAKAAAAPAKPRTPQPKPSTNPPRVVPGVSGAKPAAKGSVNKEIQEANAALARSGSTRDFAKLRSLQRAAANAA